MQNPMTPTGPAPEWRRTSALEDDVALGVLPGQGPDQGGEVPGPGAAHTEEEVRGDSAVAVAGQPLAAPQQLGADPAALVEDDQARPGRRGRRKGTEVRELDVGGLAFLLHSAILPRPARSDRAAPAHTLGGLKTSGCRQRPGVVRGWSRDRRPAFRRVELYWGQGKR